LYDVAGLRRGESWENLDFTKGIGFGRNGDAVWIPMMWSAVPVS
jgi:hypothetical protein